VTRPLSSSLESAPGPSPSASISLRHANVLLLGAMLGTLLLWNVPYGQYALYPFKLFATWVHESSHGMVMLLTGAGFEKMLIYRDTSGLAYPSSGVTAAGQAFVSSAGYMGTAFFGALFLVLGRTSRGARGVLRVVGAVMVTTALLFIRNPFGVASVAIGGVLLLVLAWRASEAIAGFALNFLAAQCCINAVLDIRVLYGSTMIVNGHESGSSDAHTMARVAGGLPWMWATIWLGWSFLLFFVALRYVRLKSEPTH
jgi:hypothetical protein